MTKTLVVATGNPGKLREMQAYLADSGWELTLKPADLDVDETGETFAENACLKASEIAKATGKWAIADDSGLAVDTLNGAPGVYSARYGNSDAERIGRLLRELGDTKNRQAQFICAIAVANPQGEIVLQSEGICKGEILYEIRGEGGFGYDPIFYVPEKQLTFAEMSPELKKSISHRGNALKNLVPQLMKLVE
ncbi:RdgB/HAM1 family non-canonical purine NTP pyrophosphatase [Sphaerospermopsis kisseleviana CS-549]|uniref:dITP/XTP pyrophosphatase n=2 Tax=Sphaerospermopsis TaxID=752201 RepID=A0A479ZV65_9CYAN|nr:MULTISPECIES: RdgB/HAM1 family non-canonical purine NTP pyrophosphatase [Sphaerospermopsis]BAZ82786.1 RdgB/HAM1 family non-canonical purine NTP pyrophosphatase [Sphaerospermopsis kisseleviana NIES-73]MBD2132787.1 RdgB/HAM1 family non-canonical purine NTP pyrophosphatase [Sphaerospermopsis sp. FACHB-1094]MBD2144795.1 RdgB/HAM1 family non-canonical purine NTP pyrophosphatase [Sphaerospermopsis sp. FACHB-1194]MDB9444296.1 RdgB/HAM1 family non-canonical purine NTP pyrophosphatase [Sphaerospermop